MGEETTKIVQKIYSYLSAPWFIPVVFAIPLVIMAIIILINLKKSRKGLLYIGIPCTFCSLIMIGIYFIGKMLIETIIPDYAQLIESFSATFFAEILAFGIGYLIVGVLCIVMGSVFGKRK